MTTHILNSNNEITTVCFLSERGAAERQRLGPDPERRWHLADVRWHHCEHRRCGCSHERDARRRSGCELWRGSGPRAGVRWPRAGDPRHPTGPAHGWFRAPAVSGLPPALAQERNDELNRTSLFSLSCLIQSDLSQHLSCLWSDWFDVSTSFVTLSFTSSQKCSLFIHFSSARLFSVCGC